MYQRIRKPIVISTAILFHLLLVFHLFFSPVIIILASYRSVINASFIAFVFMFLLSLFFGRAYCSWFCPGCGIQELMSVLIKKKSRNSKALFIKYFIFGIWIGTIVTGYITTGIHKVDLTYGLSDISTERKIILTIGAIILIVPLTVIFGKFAACKYICWQAPFMIIGTIIRNYFRFPGLRLRSKPEICNRCNTCTAKCPMNIDVLANVVKGDMNNSECILCGNCIDHCHLKAIQFSFKK
jgi:polyferredoxin